MTLTRCARTLRVVRRVGRETPTAVTVDPVVCFTVPWRLPRSHSLTVIVKATAEIGPDGSLDLAGEPDPPCGDLYADDDGVGALRYPSDFAILKPRADVLVSGVAYAPSPDARIGAVAFRFGHPVSGALGAASDGEPMIERRLAVFGERTWSQALVKLAPGDAAAFEAIPLVWERCFGGPGFAANPVGAGSGSGPEGKRLPNFEDPQNLIASPSDRPRPACLGPISPGWSARSGLRGSYGGDWLRARWPWFPDDFDWRYFQAAAPEQQREQVQGDEPFEIQGMRPHGASWVGALPGVVPHCFAHRSASTGHEMLAVRLKLDTVLFDVEAGRVQLLWRGLLEVSDRRASEIDELFVAVRKLGAPTPTLEQAHAELLRAAAELEAGPELAEAGFSELTAGAAGGPLASGPDEPPQAEHLRQRLREAGVPSWWFRDDFEPAAATAEPAEVERYLVALGAGDESIASLLGRVCDRAAHAERLRGVAVARLDGGEPLDGVQWQGANLSDLDLSGRSLVGADLRDANLRRCRLHGANLHGAQLDRSDCIDASFDDAVLAQASMTSATLSGATFDRARLTEADFSGSDAQGCHFVGAEGDHAQAVGADLQDADFSRARLADFDLTDAKLGGATFEEAEIPRVRLYGAEAERLGLERAGLAGARANEAVLREARLVGARAVGAVLDDAKLDRADCRGADLDRASLVRASCKQAVFSSTRLREAQLRGADLQGANLLGADCMKASFEEARLTGADLRGANLHAAETWQADLTGVQLEQAIVSGTKLEGKP